MRFKVFPVVRGWRAFFFLQSSQKCNKIISTFVFANAANLLSFKKVSWHHFIKKIAKNAFKHFSFKLYFVNFCLILKSTHQNMDLFAKVIWLDWFVRKSNLIELTRQSNLIELTRQSNLIELTRKGNSIDWLDEKLIESEFDWIRMNILMANYGFIDML